MRFADIFRYFTKSRSARSARDWNAARYPEWVQKPGEKKDAHAQEYADAGSIVRQAHWIALVCFIEELDPRTLSLSPLMLEKIENDIKRLKELNSLEALNAVLELLCTQDTTLHIPRNSDADPS